MNFYAAVIVILVILLLFYFPIFPLIFLAIGAVVYAVTQKKVEGGHFIDPSYDNVFNYEKKIIKDNKLHQSGKHYMIVNRGEKSSRFALVGHSINPYFGNAGQDHFVVDISKYLHYVVNKRVDPSSLLSQLDSSYQQYVIPDDSVWYSHLNYYFLGQTADPQPIMLHLDGLIMKNFAFDFEFGFSSITPTDGVYDYLVEKRSRQLSKIDKSLLNLPKDVYDHYNLLFIKRLKDLLDLARTGNPPFDFNTLLGNAGKLVDTFKIHPHWPTFWIKEDLIKKTADGLKLDFPELRDVEIQRFVRNYLLLSKDHGKIKQHLLIHILGKGIDHGDLFDEFMQSKERLDIFPIFSVVDHKTACKKLISDVNVDLSQLTRESMQSIIINLKQKLTVENIKEEILKEDKFIKVDEVKEVNEGNFKDIKEYIEVWDDMASHNIKTLHSSEKMRQMIGKRGEQRKIELAELREKSAAMSKETEIFEEKQRMAELPEIIKRKEKSKIYDYDMSDFEGSTESEIREVLEDYEKDAEEIEETMQQITRGLGWIFHYKKELAELKLKYP
jgi:hypothetical protein